MMSWNKVLSSSPIKFVGDLVLVAVYVEMHIYFICVTCWWKQYKTNILELGVAYRALKLFLAHIKCRAMQIPKDIMAAMYCNINNSILISKKVNHPQN